jgi:hypothetical protein
MTGSVSPEMNIVLSLLLLRFIFYLQVRIEIVFSNKLT